MLFDFCFVWRALPLCRRFWISIHYHGAFSFFPFYLLLCHCQDSLYSSFIFHNSAVMSTSILSERQVVQIVSFTILNDSTIEQRFSQEGRRWRKAMRTIRNQTGWLRTFWGRDMNTSHKIDIFIVWTDIQAAESFQTCPSFEAVLEGINISPLTVHCITTHGDLSPHGLTEIVTLFFPTSLTHEDQESFEEQLQHYTARLPHDEIRSTAHGWTVGPVGRVWFSSSGRAWIRCLRLRGM